MMASKDILQSREGASINQPQSSRLHWKRLDAVPAYLDFDCRILPFGMRCFSRGNVIPRPLARRLYTWFLCVRVREEME